MDLLAVALICGLSAPPRQLYGLAMAESQGNPATISVAGAPPKTFPDEAAATQAAVALASAGPIRVGLTGIPLPRGADAKVIADALAPCRNMALASARWSELATQCPAGAVAECVASRWRDGPPDPAFAAAVVSAAATAPSLPKVPDTPPAGAVPPALPPTAAPPQPAEEDSARGSPLFPTLPDPPKAPATTQPSQSTAPAPQSSSETRFFRGPATGSLPE